jgi:hypothetical protein
MMDAKEQVFLKVLFSVAMITAVTTAANAIECPSNKGVFRDTLGGLHTLMFEDEDSGSLVLEHGKTKLKYRVFVTHSNGFSREYMAIGRTDKVASSNKPVASSVVLRMNPDFSPYRGSGEPAYLVIPDLPSNLYYADGFRDLENYVDLLPGVAWSLTSCRR